MKTKLKYTFFLISGILMGFLLTSVVSMMNLDNENTFNQEVAEKNVEEFCSVLFESDKNRYDSFISKSKHYDPNAVIVDGCSLDSDTISFDDQSFVRYVLYYNDICAMDCLNDLAGKSHDLGYHFSAITVDEHAYKNNYDRIHPTNIKISDITGQYSGEYIPKEEKETHNQYYVEVTVAMEKDGEISEEMCYLDVFVARENITQRNDDIFFDEDETNLVCGFEIRRPSPFRECNE